MVATPFVDRQRGQIDDAGAARWPHRRSTTATGLLPGLFYPFYGMWLIVSRPELARLVRSRIWPCVGLSVAVLAFLFTFAFLPQVAFLAIFHRGTSAWISGVFLVLGEAAAIVAILFEIFLVDKTLSEVFDRAFTVSKYPGMPSGWSPTPSSVKAQYSPFSFRQTAEFVILLPLNMVPVIGVPLFIYVTGRRAGPLHHHRLFLLAGRPDSWRRRWIARNRASYTCFGIVHLMLQLVPVASMFFLFSTAAGAGEWAAAVFDDFRELPPLDDDRSSRLESGGEEPSVPTPSNRLRVDKFANLPPPGSSTPARVGAIYAPLQGAVDSLETTQPPNVKSRLLNAIPIYFHQPRPFIPTAHGRPKSYNTFAVAGSALSPPGLPQAPGQGAGAGTAPAPSPSPAQPGARVYRPETGLAMNNGGVSATDGRPSLEGERVGEVAGGGIRRDDNPIGVGDARRHSRLDGFMPAVNEEPGPLLRAPLVAQNLALHNRIIASRTDEQAGVKDWTRRNGDAAGNQAAWPGRR